MKTLIQFPDSHAIGDTLYFLSIDYKAELTDCPIHWLLYLPNRAVYTPDAGGQWINWPLWRFLQDAGFFRRLMAVSNIDWTDRHSDFNKALYRKLIYLTHGEHYDQIETERPITMQPTLMPEVIRLAFSRLAVTDEIYATVQFSSAHCNYDFCDPLRRYEAKRIHPETLVALCEEIGIGCLRFVGSPNDWQLAEDAILRLSIELPEMRCENHCGPSLAKYFRLLYNSGFHICTESNSVFFTAQLGIKTVIVFFNRSEPYTIPTTNLAPFVSDRVRVMMDPRPIFGGLT